MNDTVKIGRSEDFEAFPKEATVQIKEFVDNALFGDYKALQIGHSMVQLAKWNDPAITEVTVSTLHTDDASIFQSAYSAEEIGQGITEIAEAVLRKDMEERRG